MYKQPDIIGEKTFQGSGLDDIRPGRAISFTRKVLAVIGGVDWAAYIGPADWSDQEIMDHGRKLTFEAAIDLCPDVSYKTQLHYRG